MILGFANFDFEKCPKIQKIEKKKNNFRKYFFKKNHQNSRKFFWARIFFIFAMAVNRDPRRARTGFKSDRNLPELRGVSAFGVPKGHQISVRKSLNFRGKFHHFRDRT